MRVPDWIVWVREGSRCDGSQSRSGNGDLESGCWSRIKPLQFSELLLDEVGITLMFIPSVNELEQEQGLQKYSHFFWGSLHTKGQ